MKYLVFVSVLIAMFLAGCGGDDAKSSNGSNSNSSTSNDISGIFSIEFSTDMSLSEAEGKASAGNRNQFADNNYAMVRFEAAVTSMTPRLVQILFANDTLTPGEQAVDRVDVATYISQDSETIPIGCDVDEEAGLTVNITAVNGNLVSGEVSFEIGNCEHYINPDQAINVETVSVSGTFTDVPYKLAE